LGRISSLLGRAKGDELLQTASILGDWIQPGNLVTRPSSDEFVTVLPGRDSEAALAVACHQQAMPPPPSIRPAGAAVVA
jgi:GGDEF domain-containing protein